MKDMKHKHIIWDWSGTLLNDTPFSFFRICEVLRKNGLPFPSFDYYLDHFTFPIESFLAPLLAGISSPSVGRLVREFSDLYNRGFRYNCALHPGVISVLSRLKERGATQYVLSARDHDLLADDLDYYGIAPYFERILGSEKRSRHGKIAQGRKFIASLAGASPDMVLIGDTVHDFAVSGDLGMDCILLATGSNSFRALKRTGARVVAREHEELLGHLSSPGLPTGREFLWDTRAARGSLRAPPSFIPGMPKVR